jgi:glycosyltransferase involved in cell wall biosynthesis
MNKLTGCIRATRRVDPSEFNWAIDNFTLQDGALLSFGWIMHQFQPIVSATIALSNDDARRCHLSAIYGTERADIEAAFPGRAEARFTGFHYLGSVTFDNVQLVELEVTLQDGATAVLPTRLLPERPAFVGAASLRRSRLQVYRYLLRRTLSYIARAEFAGLVNAVSRYSSSLPKKVAAPLSYLHKKVAAMDRPAFLVIDHALGGGANQFRNRLVDELLDNRYQVVILSFHVQTLRYVVEYKFRKDTARLEISLEEFIEGLEDFDFARIYFNNTVSFTKQLLLLQALTRIRIGKEIPVTFFLHDFHSICPSHFLINSAGKHCRLPSIDSCRECLPQIRDGLVTLFREKDIDLWRKHWLNFLAVSDELVCFSESSKSLLLRAYPQLRNNKLVVRPHDIQDFSTRRVAFDLNAPLHLGIVGHINAHKGAAIVHGLADLMDQRNNGERLTIFGALDGRRAGKCLTVTGRYERNGLADLISQHGVNMLAFTSIWPETFSFVVSELMSFGLPIICFDLGAPAERVEKYPLGRVVPVCDTSEFMEEIARFYLELRNTQLHEKPLLID